MNSTESLQMLRALSSNDMLSRDYRDALRMGADALESKMKLVGLGRTAIRNWPTDYVGMKKFIFELVKDMIQSEVPAEEVDTRTYELLQSICNDYLNTR